MRKRNLHRGWSIGELTCPGQVLEHFDGVIRQVIVQRVIPRSRRTHASHGVSKSCPILADLAGSHHRVNRTNDLWIFVNGKNMVRKGLTKPKMKRTHATEPMPPPNRGPVRLSDSQPSGLREPYLVWSSQKAWNLSTFRTVIRSGPFRRK